MKAVLIIALLVPLIAHAQVFKCTDASGNVSLQQTPCPMEHAQEDKTKIAGYRNDAVRSDDSGDGWGMNETEVAIYNKLNKDDPADARVLALMAEFPGMFPSHATDLRKKQLDYYAGVSEKDLRKNAITVKRNDPVQIYRDSLRDPADVLAQRANEDKQMEKEEEARKLRALIINEVEIARMRMLH